MKAVSLLFVGLALFAFGACGGDDADKYTGPTETIELNVEGMS